MIEIPLAEMELYHSDTREFTYPKAKVLRLEHSLISVHKWEQKWHIPFMDKKPKTPEQERDYFKCMSISGEITDEDIARLTRNDINRINAYITDKATATWFKNIREVGKDKSIITAERIYGQMVQYRIPFECAKWHLNSLLTLIRVCYENNKPKKKMKKSDIYERYDQINEANKRLYNTKG